LKDINCFGKNSSVFKKRRNTKIISILIILSAVGVFIYKSPDEAYWLKENHQDAIKIGRTYSYYLLNGYKQGLLKMSIDPAKTKIEKSNFHQIAISEIHDLIEKKKIHIEITAPLFAEQRDEDMVPILINLAGEYYLSRPAVLIYQGQ
jgi:hypothetical protein